MKLKIPPGVVFLSFGLLMYLLAEFLPVGYFDFFGRHHLMIVLAISAILIAGVALFQFYAANTTIDPTQPGKTKKLVTNGIYAYTRNPMYLAMLLLLLAWGVWLGNAFNTLLAAGFVAYMNRFQIEPEEQALTKIFNKDYKQYGLLVRRWF
ncbi:Protein-S-isoprenylcysteine O-methyltransferase Ste14 [Pricia antarctica]|uniref:Protein-S-isoprenylcysteine O-methyltransferase Ste14 n=1 Tax=Pricia antarctica TaxID=641691 RepID=A0A1G7ESC5_9FLAO|nr:isoprenylcysteine carboxylmethyltransferase family protein [Pricia antarctica]SDE66551.1 Protein-S-isoprenylcysteine O-methyltransferase Ste14 [Pricia antarctica]